MADRKWRLNIFLFMVNFCVGGYSRSESGPRCRCALTCQRNVYKSNVKNNSDDDEKDEKDAEAEKAEENEDDDDKDDGSCLVSLLFNFAFIPASSFCLLSLPHKVKCKNENE